MIVALASPRIAASIDDGLDRIERLLAEASTQGAKIVCFPEAYLPGLRGQDFDVCRYDLTQQERVLRAVSQLARTHAIGTILGMERITERGRQIVAVVIDPTGEIQGYQTKNQLDPTEEPFYVPGHTRQLFEIGGRSLASRSATRAGAILKPSGGRRRARRRSSSILSSPAVTVKVSR